MSVSNAPDLHARRPGGGADFLSFMRASVVLNKATATAQHPADEAAADLLFSTLMDNLLRDIALTVGSAMRGTLEPPQVREWFIDLLDQALALPLPEVPTRLVNVLGDGIEQLWDAP